MTMPASGSGLCGASLMTRNHTTLGIRRKGIEIRQEDYGQEYDTEKIHGGKKQLCGFPVPNFSVRDFDGTLIIANRHSSRFGRERVIAIGRLASISGN